LGGDAHCWTSAYWWPLIKALNAMMIEQLDVSEHYCIPGM